MLELATPGASPSRAQVARLVAATNTAPSADNCQPFRFAWDGEALTIFHDEDRARNILDHRGRASQITLGGVAAALSIAASAEGFTARLDLTPGLPGTAWATARFEPLGEAAPHELHGWLERRCTDRRLYQGGSVPASVRSAIEGDAAGDPGCHVRFVEGCPPALRDYLLRGDGYVWHHDRVYRDIMRWFRFTQREIDETRDGAPWRSLGLDIPELPGLGFARSRLVQTLLDRGGLSRIWRYRLQTQLDSSAGLFCVTAPSGSPIDFVRAGRLGLFAWLRLNGAGFGVQPYIVQSLFAHAFAEGDPAPGTLPEFVELFRGGPATIARAFGLAANERPLWLFRVGLSPAMPALLRTKRLPVEKVLSILDSAPP